jgi:hypothetical protein
MAQSIRIEWVFGKPQTGVEDDEARAIKAAMEVLDRGGTDYVRAERDYMSAVHRGADAAADEGEDQFSRIARLWIEATEAANDALTDTWAKPGTAGCVIHAREDR